MKFKNLPLVQKLGVGFGAVLLIVALSCALIFKQTRDLAEIQRLSAISSQIVQVVDELQFDAALARSARYKIVLSGDKADLPGFLDVKAELQKDFVDASALTRTSAPQFAARLETVETALMENYLAAFLEPQVAQAIVAATRAQALASATSPGSNAARKAYETALALLQLDTTRWSAELVGQAARSMTETEWVVAVSGLTSILMGLGMAWFIARSVGGPLKQMAAAMRSLSSGDHQVEVPARDQTDEIGQMAGAVQVFKMAAVEKLRLEAEASASQRDAQGQRERAEAARLTSAQQQAQVVEQIASGLNKLASGDLLQRIDHPFAPEYEALRGDFNAAVVQLQQTMKEVFTSTGTIRSGTGEISTASDELSRRTEQQAASLEETAAALAEITAAMQRTSEGANHARSVVGVAESTADQSSEVINRTIQAMSNIEKGSQQISQIMGVIDEIAFQTNLLALNAGVEAARAGEAGRGFAVVASEVRGLAQRCAEAAKEVKTLVRSSDQQVQAGVNLVADSGKMLSKIVAQVKELKGIVSDIAGSAEHQAAGLSEVNIAIRQMDQVTQQNAAMAEEATAAARNLAHEGAELVRLVGRFDVGANAMAAAPARPAAQKPAPRVAPKKAAAGGGSRGPAVGEDWQEF